MREDLDRVGTFLGFGCFSLTGYAFLNAENLSDKKINGQICHLKILLTWDLGRAKLGF